MNSLSAATSSAALPLPSAHAGSTAELLCNAASGAEVAVSPVMGKGFPIDRLPASTTSAVLMFATGSGISPIRAVIDSGALAGRDLTLYYGTRNTGMVTLIGVFAGLYFAVKRGVWLSPNLLRPDSLRTGG